MRIPSGASVPGFSHTIQVDKNLVRLLSDQTYTSFTNCIRELVINAYDADATQVSIDVDLPDSMGRAEYAGSLTIMDNGHGMTADEFLRYTRIAPGGPLRERSRLLGRPRVGQFGIGYLAAFPFCERMELRTSAGDEEIVATFNCAAYFRSADKFVELGDVPVHAQIERRRSPLIKHATGTRIHLLGLSRDAVQYLQPHREEPRPGRKIESIWEWPGDKRLAWELGQVLPITWDTPHQDWQHMLGIIRPSNDPGLSVSLNGDPIRKPWPSVRSERDRLTRLAPAEGEERDIPLTLSEQDIAVPGLSETPGRTFMYRYVAITPHQPIQPAEFRGVQLRLRGVGLGPPIPYKFIPGFTAKENELIRVFIEVHLTGGFDRQITLDRTQLKRSPWMLALFRDLQQRVFADATRHALSEARLSKSLNALQRVTDVRYAGTTANIRARVNKYASEIGYAVESEPIRLEDAHVDHVRNVVVIPKQIPNPKIRLEGTDYEVVQGSPTDRDLQEEWVRIKTLGRIEVSPQLAEVTKGSSLQYRDRLMQLAKIEWRCYRLCQSEEETGERAMRKLARAIKADIARS